MKKINSVIIAVLVVAGAYAFSFSFAGEFKKGVSVKEIKKEDVCMLVNRLPGEPTIAVAIEGKTYYACCPDCVTKLQGNKLNRKAKDLATGREIDKSAAFITEGPDGGVLYFESRKTAERFFSSLRK